MTGLTFNSKKLQLAVASTKYLGHILSADGIRVDDRKVSAVTSLPAPTSKLELQRFLGMVNYLAKFVPNHSDKTAPLRALLRAQSEFLWDSNAQAAFQLLKSDITNSPVLGFYNPSLPITLSVDASQFGIGVAFFQDGHPVEYASTSLTDTQKRYAQVEKELLAIVFALEHFHFYVTGTKPTVETDHKPLLAIVKKPLHLLSPRLQRMVLRISRYTHHLIYVPGTKLPIADALSRSPLAAQSILTDDLEGPCVALHAVTALSDDAAQAFRLATENDPELKAVQSYLLNGWPQHHSTLKGRPGNTYWPIKEELHISNGLLYRGDRLVIPASERHRVLKLLHNAHQGINTCVRKAKLHTFWPGMVADMETYVRQCSVCRTRDMANQRAPLRPHPVPPLPWHTVGMDLYHGRKPTLLLVDYHSKFVEIEELTTSTAPAVIAAIKPHFARYGHPTKVITDNGPPFNSKEMASFFRDRGVQHVTSSPHYPQSNGMVERHIQTIKNLMAKAHLAGQDPYIVLLEYRATPMYHMPAPSQALMGRLLRTPNTTNNATLVPSFPIAQNIQSLIDRQNKMKHDADVRARASTGSILPMGSCIRYQVSHRNWQPATVVAHDPSPDSYIIKTSTGQLFRRNRHHLRESHDSTVPEVLPPPTQRTWPDRSATEPTPELPGSTMDSRVAPSRRPPSPSTPPPSHTVSTVPTLLPPLTGRIVNTRPPTPPPMFHFRPRSEPDNGAPAVVLPHHPPPPFPHSPANAPLPPVQTQPPPFTYTTRAGRQCKKRTLYDV